MGTFGRHLGNCASALFALGLCVSCGNAGNGDYIELYPPEGGSSGAAGSDGGGTSGGGAGGSESTDAGLGGSGDPDGGEQGGASGAGGSEQQPDGGPGPSLQCQVAFVTPEPETGSLYLGRADDVDGTACGSEFATRVRVASNAKSVALFVNGTTNSGLTQDVSSLGAYFTNVQLSNMGDTANTLRAVATMPNGSTCEATLDTEVFVDCDVPSCTITAPSGSEYLNAGDDSSPGNPFRVDFEVSTEAENAGQVVLLTLDGDFDNRLSAEVADESNDGVARFSDVGLAEGRRLAQAECRDAAGNVAHSALAEWTVDTEPCIIFLSSLPDPIIPTLDLDGGTAGIQLELSGSVTGQGCDQIIAGRCGSPPSGQVDAPASGGAFTVPITLASSDGSFDVCATVSDEAGNTDDASVPVRVRVTPPSVLITSPGSGSSFNHANDLDDDSPSCEIAFAVNCSDVGAPVELRQGGNVLDSSNCVASGGGGAGVATFSSVSVTSRDNGSDASIIARQTADGLTGDSTALLIQPDCHAPQLSFAQNVHCGGQLSLTGNDQDSGTGGLQYAVNVFNDGVQAVTLSLSIDGGPVTQPASTSSTGSATFFDGVDFGAVEATASLVACATDAQGNEGCTAACEVEVADVPLVTISSPSAGATLVSPDDDCALGTSGLQVRVQGTVDAADGSAVVIDVGSTHNTGITVSSQAFDACVNAADDGLGKTLTVSVTDGARPIVPATSSITVNIDGTAPTNEIGAPLGEVQERREGIVLFSWDAVTDAGGGPLAAYQLRCATTAIDDDTDWDNATAFPFTLTPKASGTETVDLEGFRVGTTMFCAVRGQDLANNLTPLPASNASSAVTVPFLTQEYTSIVAEGGFTFTGLAPIGDVNGDGVDDFIYGLEDHVAQVFFGGEDLDTTPDITIDGPFGKFAAVVAGVGDVNNDGHADFAVSAWGVNGQNGSVYVFFGHAQGDPWDSTISVSEAPCTGADLCIGGTEPGALFGWDVTGTDFDGDAITDLVIGARFQDSGRVYVLKGGAQLAASGSDLPVPNPLPANDLQGFVIDAPANTSDFGISIASVGEGADGRGDLVVGANGFFNAEDGAAAFIPGQAYSGSGLVTPGTPAAVFATGVTAEFASVVRGIGDFNGDGTGDVAVSVSDGSLVGRVDVFPRASGDGGFGSGSPITFDNDTLEQVNWGAYLAAGLHPTRGLLADLDKDTRSELLVGAFGITASADVFYGQIGATARSRSEADSRFTGGAGDLVPIFVGDVNGDGWNDVAVLEFDPIGDPSVTPKITVLY
jgi:hypothetical protein